jgi:hypothetical protein
MYLLFFGGAIFDVVYSYPMPGTGYHGGAGAAESLPPASARLHRPD